MWTQIRLQSDQGPHCLPVCKIRFEKSARIFSRRHKQTTFSDAVFLGALRVKDVFFSFQMTEGRKSQIIFPDDRGLDILIQVGMVAIF